MQTIVLFVIAAALAAGCSATAPSVRKAQVLYEGGNYPAAERAADSALVSAPEEPTLWRLKIASAIRSGAHRRGVDLYLQWHRLRRHYDRVALRAMAVSTLWQALRLPDEGARVQAIAAASDLAMDPLRGDVAGLIQDDSAVVAATATVALAAGDPRARARVMQLWRSPNPEVRAIVVAGLGRRRDRRARAALVASLSDPEPPVRRAAAAAIGQNPSATERTRLTRLARSDPSGAVRAAAWQALSRSRPGDALALGQAALTDPYLGSRLAGLRLLAQEPRKSRVLVAELARSSDLYVALRAAVMLHKAGGEAPIRTLQWALSHPRWTIRVAALSALPEATEPTTALDLLAAPLADERAEVRLAAARILLRFGEQGRAAPIFVAALDAPRDEPRIQAAIDLIRMHDERGRAALSKLGQSPSAATRRAAARAHRYLDDATVPLVTALGDASAAVRVEAAASLLTLLR